MAANWPCSSLGAPVGRLGGVRIDGGLSAADHVEQLLRILTGKKCKEQHQEGRAATDRHAAARRSHAAPVFHPVALPFATPFHRRSP